MLILISLSLLAVMQRPIEVPPLPTDSPDAPRPDAARIERGDVTFVTGDLGAEDRFDGKTWVSAEYQYEATHRWQVRGGRVVLSTHWHRIGWTATHRIWLRRPPGAEAFWTDRLVRHELDHVDLSSDRRWVERFGREVRSLGSATLTLGELGLVRGDLRQPGRVDAAVEGWIQAAVQTVFDETMALIQIRYAELDRRTDHGRKSP